MHSGQDLGVRGVRCPRLLFVLVAAEGGNPFARFDLAPRPRGKGFEGGGDPRLPVDEGAVAVEGEGVEVRELHAGVSIRRRASPAARTSLRVADG